jgi:Domain of unknown function (DUF4124)/Penicillin-Binding Protein C-terminus Family
MHLRKSWVLLSVLTAFAVQAGVIYKWTDADGVVHYSDQAVPGAEKVGASSTPINRSAAPSTSGRPAPNAATAKPALSYQLTISSPANEQTFFNDDVAAVRLEVQPTLKPSHSITWHLNGKTLDQPPTAQSFALQGLERGTYVLTATLVDQETGESQSSPSVTFYFRQPSALSPAHR